jgi:hypothetical protein
MNEDMLNDVVLSVIDMQQCIKLTTASELHSTLELVERQLEKIKRDLLTIIKEKENDCEKETE